MSHKSPTNLQTPRNIALQKGAVPAGFAEINNDGVKPVINDDPGEAARNTGNTPPPAQPSPFK